MESTENATVTVEVSVKVRKEDGELVDVISATSKLTKADAGIESSGSSEQIYISIQPGADGNFTTSSIGVNYTGKSGTADTGFKH